MKEVLALAPLALVKLSLAIVVACASVRQAAAPQRSGSPERPVSDIGVVPENVES